MAANAPPSTPSQKFQPVVAAYNNSTPQAVAALAPPPRTPRSHSRSSAAAAAAAARRRSDGYYDDHDGDHDDGGGGTAHSRQQPRSSSDLSETFELLDELTAVFHSAEDLDAVHELRAAGASVYSTAESRKRALKQTIRTLSGRVEQARERATPDEPDDAHAQRVEACEREKREVIRDIMAGEERVRALEGNLRELSAEDAEVHSALEQYNRSVKTDIPSLKHALSLYVTISHVRWNYRGQGTEVQGYVAKQRENDVVPFRFARGEPVDTADRLWSMIET